MVIQIKIMCLFFFFKLDNVDLFLNNRKKNLIQKKIELKF